MRFSLREQTCRITNVNNRAENFGKEKKPAADIAFRCSIENGELRQFSKQALEGFYQKPTTGQDDMHSLTALVYPNMKQPIGWEEEVVGAEVTVHRGLSAKSSIKLKGCIINRFTTELMQGGSMQLSYTVRFYPEDKDQIGELCMLNGQDVVVSVVSPTEREQKKERDLLDAAEKDDEKEEIEE